MPRPDRSALSPCGSPARCPAAPPGCSRLSLPQFPSPDCACGARAGWAEAARWLNSPGSTNLQSCGCCGGTAAAGCAVRLYSELHQFCCNFPGDSSRGQHSLVRRESDQRIQKTGWQWRPPLALSHHQTNNQVNTDSLREFVNCASGLLYYLVKNPQKAIWTTQNFNYNSASLFKNP